MAKLTRRGFIGRTSAGAVALGALAAPGLVAAAQAAGPVGTHTPAQAGELHEPLMAHVRNVAIGEVVLLVGTREVVVHDHELVRRLVKAARS